MQISPKLGAGLGALALTATGAGIAYNHVDRQRREGATQPNKAIAMATLTSGAALGLLVSIGFGARANALAAADQAAAAVRVSNLGRGVQLGVSAGPIVAYGAYNSLFDTDGRPNLLDPVGNVQRRLARSEVIGDDG
jgi:hypothetical protein